MTSPFPDPASLAQHRAFCLHAQSTEEARQAQRIGEQLRQVRSSAGCSRADLARALRLDLELIVAVENGYGPLTPAQSILEQARRVCTS
jgi:ribosome-binding protein aMBF1 (putative translation factor)